MMKRDLEYAPPICPQRSGGDDRDGRVEIILVIITKTSQITDRFK
jgi:hypothetical protein